MVMQEQTGKGVKTPYAWVVLAVLFVGAAASFGMRTSFGAYISPWERDFSATRTMVASVSMLSFVVYAFAQPLVGKLNDYFEKNIVPTAGILLIGISLFLTSQAGQLWHLFILFGVVFSFGVAACSNVISAAIITNWFVEKRGFALGLATSGLAVGQLILFPASLFLIESLGWRTTMAALSIIITVVVTPLFIIFLRSKPEEKGMKPYGYVESGNDSQNSNNETAGARSSLPILGVLKERVFWLITIPYFICGFSDVGLIQTHLTPMSEGKGFPITSVAIAFSLIAAFNIAGSITSGHLSDHYNRKRQLVIIYIIRAVTFVFLIAIQQPLIASQRPWLLMPFAVLYGALEMASITPTISLTVELFNRYSIGAVVGLVSVSHQLGGAFGSFLPGVLYDQANSYSAAIVFAIILLLGAAALSMRIPEVDKRLH